MIIKLLSSLAKVFPDEICNGFEPCGINSLKNGRTSFQLAVKTQENADLSINISGASDCIEAFFVRSVPAKKTAMKNHDDYFLRGANPGEYPDILMPLDASTSVIGGEWSAFWFEFAPGGRLVAGEYEIIIDISDGAQTQSVAVRATVYDAELPKQELFCTHWFHSDCLAQYYGVDVFSDEYWRITENFLRAAARHGINLILTPLFTPPLDTAVGGERPTVQLVDVRREGKKYFFFFDKLKKWIELAQKCGIEYFEMSHLFTQWGAKHAPKIMAQTEKGYKKIFGWRTKASGRAYADFLRQFAPELIRFIDENGLRERCFFHTSDEPGIKKYKTYSKAAALTNELFGQFKIMDALSEYKYYEDGIIKSPITNIERIDEFAGKVPELWTYYCCNPCDRENPNRFNAMPSPRNRILGFLMYKYDVKGFLHWGYNFYFTRYSRRLVDPFTETDAGKQFPSGDSYVVYPAADGTPYISLRLKVFYDAIEDYSALRLLETKMPRTQIIAMLEKGLVQPLSSVCYPHSEQWIIEKRKEINELIAHKI